MATSKPQTTKMKLPKELFDILIKEGDLGTLLFEGGKDLTRSQMQQVKELAGKQSKSKLERMAAELEGTDGYQNFMSLPIIAKIIGKNRKDTKTQPTEIEKQKATKTKRKDPSISAVPPKTIVPLKVGDSEADILAKMLNLYKQDFDDTKKRYDSYGRSKKELQNDRDRDFRELMDAFEGKGPKSKDEKKKSESKLKKKSKLLKYAVLGGAGLLLSSKAFAGEGESKTSGFSTTIKDALDSIKKAFQFKSSDTSNLPEGVYSEQEIAAKKAAEDYLGSAISPEEWDKLVRATAAEASMNKKEEAGVMGVILNRARRKFGGGEGSISQALEEKNQFQSVTGKPGDRNPSEKYVKGPAAAERESIMQGAATYLSVVPKPLEHFTAADTKSYTKGTNIGFRNNMIKKGGVQIGGSIFEMPIPEPMAVAQEQPKPEIPVSIKKPKMKIKPIIIVQNNTNNIKQGDMNIMNSTTEESDKSIMMDKQYYRK